MLEQAKAMTDSLRTSFVPTGHNSPTSILQREVESLANRLTRISRVIDNLPPDHGACEDASDRVPTEKDVRTICRARLARAHYFEKSLFADPAWDMLLDLFAADLAQMRVSVSSLCIASNVPATTALRWIQTLQEHGLVKRCEDIHDKRRAFVSLTADGRERMKAYLAEHYAAGGI